MAAEFPQGKTRGSYHYRESRLRSLNVVLRLPAAEADNNVPTLSLTDDPALPAASGQAARSEGRDGPACLRNDHRHGSGRRARNSGRVDAFYFVVVGTPGLDRCIDVRRLRIDR